MSGDSVDIRKFLNDEIFSNGAICEKIGQQLRKGCLVIIRDAFKEDFAESIYTCLDNIKKWEVNENFSNPVFSYRHHSIYSGNLFPDELLRCRNIFSSPASKKFISELSGKDCNETVEISPSWYMPGDYLTPHTDHANRRTTTFVWHLTKNWEPNWGGWTYWCRSGQLVQPSFNTLMLFNVTTDSYHLVSPVSPYALGKRLAISGWYTGIFADTDSDYLSSPVEIDSAGKVLAVK